jgi:hypothetical protein
MESVRVTLKLLLLAEINETLSNRNDLLTFDSFCLIVSNRPVGHEMRFMDHYKFCKRQKRETLPCPPHKNV